MIVFVARKLDSAPRCQIHLADLKPASALFQIFAAIVDECLRPERKRHSQRQNFERATRNFI